MAGRKKKHAGPTNRSLQVSEQVRGAVAEILTEGLLKDPRVAEVELVTVTAVEMSPDLKHARVFFSLFPDSGPGFDAALEGLQSAAATIQRELAVRLRLRFTPKVDVRHDHSTRDGAAFESLLRTIRDDGDL